MRGRYVFVLEQSLGHMVHAGNLERALEAEQGIAASVVRIAHGDPRRRRGRLVSRNWSLEASWTARKALLRRVAGSSVDAIFIHTQVAALLAGSVMRVVPTVVSMDATPRNFDSLWESYGHGRQGALIERAKLEVNRKAFTAAGAIVTWSQWAAASVTRDYGVPEEKVHVIPPGVDVGRFRPGRQNNEGAPRILFVGADFTRKGGDDLLAAMRQIGDLAELDIVTSCPPRSLPPSARVHVGLSHDSHDLFELYERADIFALPSRGECFGLVFAEALASGLPVVACNVGAVSEMVVDGYNGLLVPPGSPTELATALRTLIERSDLRRSMGERGLRMAQRGHDAGRNCGLILDLMAKISSVRGSKPESGGGQ